MFALVAFITVCYWAAVCVYWHVVLFLCDCKVLESKNTFVFFTISYLEFSTASEKEFTFPTYLLNGWKKTQKYKTIREVGPCNLGKNKPEKMREAREGFVQDCPQPWGVSKICGWSRAFSKHSLHAWYCARQSNHVPHICNLCDSAILQKWFQLLKLEAL
jgi:hypothetical protein